MTGYANHPGAVCNCPRCREAVVARRRRALIRSRARRHPDGLTQYQFTRGMTRADALRFWGDARYLDLVVVGKSTRGASMLALRSYPIGSGRKSRRESGE